MSGAGTCGIIVIGRNEGERLRRCLTAIPRDQRTIYVDSGSTDGSQSLAQSLGAILVTLDPAIGFTAARARNAGLEKLKQSGALPDYLQMIDGDCELAASWLSEAVQTMSGEPELAVVFGRTRERFPERSIYNQQCDDEWAVPPGLVDMCGGNALFRAEALLQVNGYSDDLIAGEEPDLCLRLQQKGWKIRCIGAEMVLHDADIRHFSQWWKRARRSGHAYAEHVARHGTQAFPSWRRQVKSIIIWGFALPTMALVSTVAGIAGNGFLALPGIVAALLYPLQWVRIARAKSGGGQKRSIYASLILIGKFAEFGGFLRFHLNRLVGRRSGIIEHKISSR